MIKKTIFSVAFIIIFHISCNSIEAGTLVEQTEKIATISLTFPNATKTPTNSVPTSIHKPTIDFDTTMIKEADYRLKSVEGFPVSCDRPWENFFSPSHTWLALLCGYDPSSTLEIVNKTGLHWVLNFMDYWFKEAIENEYTLDGALLPLLWSKNEKYLYFGTYYAHDAGTYCDAESATSVLYRINVETGEVSTVLSPENNWFYGSSPDGRWLVFKNDKFYLLDRYTWDIYPIDIDGTLNKILWSQNNETAVFFTCKWTDNTRLDDISTISRYSIETNTIKQLLVYEGHFYDISTLENQIIINGIGQRIGVSGHNFLFDWESGELWEVTPTPQP